MKAKLIKMSLHDGYRLDDEKGELIASTLKGCKSMLSFKNCQAIERGYDLDELAKSEAAKLHDKSQHEDWEIWSELVRDDSRCIKIGMEKMLELMGDKKFSKEDIEECWETAHQAGRFEEKGIAKKGWQTSETFIQSLQQTEWNVEIEMESNLHIGEVADDSYPKRFPTQKPKLDAEGCFILKLKSE